MKKRLVNLFLSCYPLSIIIPLSMIYDDDDRENIPGNPQTQHQIYLYICQDVSDVTSIFVATLHINNDDDLLLCNNNVICIRNRNKAHPVSSRVHFRFYCLRCKFSRMMQTTKSVIGSIYFSHLIVY